MIEESKLDEAAVNNPEDVAAARQQGARPKAKRGMHVLGFVTSVHEAHRPEEECGTVHGPTRGANGRSVYAHGNFSGYYDYRNGEGSDAADDVRLALLTSRLGPETFRGKDILDIGCNNGLVTLSVARVFEPRRLVGIDIDTGLIDEAISALDNVRKEGDSDWQRRCEIEFRADDVVRTESLEQGTFDAILCLSVTKWIHISHGDFGVEELFRRCKKCLRPGGLLVLEPQEWSAYQKKRLLSPSERQKVAGISLRPQDFGNYLTSTLGFESVAVIRPPNAVVRGFRRPILVYRRSASPGSILSEYARDVRRKKS